MSAYRQQNGLAALIASMNPNMGPGPALLGADDGDAVQFGADYQEAVGAGYHPMQAIQHARMVMAQRHAAWCQNHGWQRGGGFPGGGFPGGGFPHPIPGGGFPRLRGDDDAVGDDGFGGDDSLDGVDQEELGAIDDEIAACEGDEESFGGDGEEQIGATISTLEHKTGQLRSLLDRLENKNNSLPERRRRKRKALLKRITNVRQLLERKVLKLRQKREKAYIKAGIPAAQAAAMAGGGAAAGAAAAAAGLSRQDIRKAEGAVMANELAAQQGLRGFYGPVHVPGQGTEVELPFVNQSNGEADPVYSKAGGTPAGETGIILQTDPFSYADFVPLGIVIQITVQGGQANDVLPGALVTNWLIDGGLSQVYGNQTVGLMASQNAGIITSSTFLAAMRQDRVKLNRTNTASLYLNLGNKLANAATIYFKVEAKLRVRVFTDDNVR